MLAVLLKPVSLLPDLWAAVISVDKFWSWVQSMHLHSRLLSIYHKSVVYLRNFWFLGWMLTVISLENGKCLCWKAELVHVQMKMGCCSVFSSEFVYGGTGYVVLLQISDWMLWCLFNTALLNSKAHARILRFLKN